MRTSFQQLSILGAVVLAIATSSAVASPITANVIGSKVGKAGLFGTEYRNGYEWDDSNQAQDNAYTDRLDLFYNVSNRTQLRAFANRTDLDGKEGELTNVFIEPAFQLFDQATNGFDGLMTTGLTISEGDDGPHQFRSILSGTIPIDNGYVVHNSVVAHEFGPESTDGLKYEARFRVMQHVPTFGEHTDIGVEMFNDFGNLRTTSGFDNALHRAGPVMTGKFTEKLGFQTGFLAGLSDAAPDTAVKFWLNYRFN